jgi:small subunit ribosomal protein S11
MFAVRPCSSSVAAAASRRRILSLQTANAFLSTTVTPATPNAQRTMLDFDNGQPIQKPQPFSYGADDIPPSGRGFPREQQARPSPFSPGLLSPPLLRSSLRYRLHCRSSRNNTMVQVTEPDGRTIGWFSGGSLKFKGVNRASYEAGYQCAVAAFQVIRRVVMEKGDVQVELYFRGFGQGREAMKTALLAVEGTEVRRLVSQIQDRTPIKIGGTRAPKARRL